MRRAHLFPGARNRGHVLITALCILAVMAGITVLTLEQLSNRYRTVYRTAAWDESLVVAESGLDMTLAQITGLLPNVAANSQAGITFTASPLTVPLSTNLSLLPGGLGMNGNVASLSLTPDSLSHGGEGATVSSATVTLNVLPLGQVLNGSLITGALALLSGSMPAINVVQLTSTGTVYLPGSSTAADVSKLDANLNRAALVIDPGTGKKVSQPCVSRTVQALLKPVFPFQNGVATDSFLHDSNSSTLFDSFSSASSQTSTNYLYDPAKARSNIQVSANGADVQLAGIIHGNLMTNQSTIAPGSAVSGTVNSSYFGDMPAISVPGWASPITFPLVGVNTLYGGLNALPLRYTFSSVAGTLHIKSPLGLGAIPGAGAQAAFEADVYVTGNVNATLIVDPGVSLHLYVAGNVNIPAHGLQNGTLLASNVQIIGVPGGVSPAMTIDTTGGAIAAIYAPTHALTVAGAGDFSGAITCLSLNIPGGADIHFDEALALITGTVIGYQLVSWQEIYNP